MHVLISCVTSVLYEVMLDNIKLKKHLMTGPARNSEFCFSKNFNVARSEAEGKSALRSRGNQTHCFARDQSLLFCYTSWLKTGKLKKKKVRKIVCMTQDGTQICRGLNEYDPITRESSKFFRYCSPKKFVSFVRPTELVSFNQWHVVRFPPIRIYIWVGRENKI